MTADLAAAMELGSAVYAFVAARLDEAKAAAESAAESDWWGAHAAEFAGANLYDELGDPSVEHADWWPGDADFAHIARHDPARVLREIAAMRAVLTAYEMSIRMLGIGLSRDKLTLLRAFAVIWEDHPDFRQEWAPQAAASA